MSQEILVLNNSYMPIAKTSWDRAIILILLERAFSIKDSTRIVKSQYLELKVPEIIVLKNVNYFKRQTTAFSKKAALMHYKVCQICGESDRTKITIDHIIPRSRWDEISKERGIVYGLNSWDNCVVLCKRHNQEKSDKLPEEIGWEIKVNPPLVDIHLDWSVFFDYK